MYSQQAVSVWGTGLSGGAPDSVRCARLPRPEDAALGNLPTAYGYNSPDCPVCTGPSGETMVGLGQRSAARSARDTWPSQRSEGGHRTVRCAPDCPVRHRLPDLQRPAMVDCVVYGNKSGTGQCPVCTGLSGAPDDRRQGWPSRFVLNGS